MNRVNVRDNASSGTIIIDHGRVDKAFRNETRAYKRVDDEAGHPAGDRVHFSFAVKPFHTWTFTRQLGAVSVAFPKKVPKKKLSDK